MMGLTRGPITLVAAGCAGLLVWTAAQIGDSSTGGYWAVYGIIAAAGLLMALSQVAGGWTKWGWPRISLGVLLIAFLPVLVCVLWVTLAGQPHGNWFKHQVLAWSGDLGIQGVVKDLVEYLAVLAFGAGLVLGLTADTAPRTPAATPVPREPRAASEPDSTRTAVDGRRREPVHSR